MKDAKSQRLFFLLLFGSLLTAAWYPGINEYLLLMVLGGAGYWLSRMVVRRRGEVPAPFASELVANLMLVGVPTASVILYANAGSLRPTVIAGSVALIALMGVAGVYLLRRNGRATGNT